MIRVGNGPDPIYPAQIVTSTHGQLRGNEEDGVVVFRGIPYAAPPVGNLRWHAPVPPTPWRGVRDALKFGSAAIQETAPEVPIDESQESGSTEPEQNPLEWAVKINSAQSEDCLYLNVWTPSTEGSRPVMVWIHGGGLVAGSGCQNAFNGSHLCRRDVVVVTINYRLAAFGFAHLDGPTNGAIPATGNEGLLDQVAALTWVRDNIKAFGGDQNNVTIFGESAGAWSVSCLLSMPSAEGLFHKAIAQSGAGNGDYSIEEASIWYTEPMLQNLGTRDPEALMSASAEAVLQAFPNGISGFMRRRGRSKVPE